MGKEGGLEGGDQARGEEEEGEEGERSCETLKGFLSKALLLSLGDEDDEGDAEEDAEEDAEAEVKSMPERRSFRPLLSTKGASSCSPSSLGL